MVATNAALAWAESPLQIAMRLDDVFFSVRPIVLSLARSTMCSFDDLLLEQTQAPSGKASGAGERVSAISFASAAPSKIRRRAELELYLRANTASNPSSTSWRLVHARQWRCWCLDGAAIRLSLQPSPASRYVRLQEDARLSQQLGGTLAFANRLVRVDRVPPRRA